MEAIVIFLAQIIAIFAALICLAVLIPVALFVLYSIWVVCSATVRDFLKERRGCE